MVKDCITKYYDRREPSKHRKYYNSLDELLIAKGLSEIVGRYIIPSWADNKTVDVYVKDRELI